MTACRGGVCRSIGCLLYDLVALTHAFEGDSLMGVMFTIIEGKLPDWPTKYSDDLHKVFTRCRHSSADYIHVSLFISTASMNGFIAGIIKITDLHLTMAMVLYTINGIGIR